MLLSFLRLLSYLPLRFCHGLGILVGWMVYGLDKRYRARLNANAQLAHIDAAARRASVGEMGKMLMEIPLLWGRPNHKRLESLAHWGEGAHLIREALAIGKGVIVLSPHLGPFEVCPQLYAEEYGHEHPITVLFRPPKQAWLRQVVLHARQRPGFQTAPANLQGVRQMLKALKSGHCVGLLPDQVPPTGLGVWAPFFGQPAYTMTLASRLAHQTGATVLLARADRLPKGRGFVVHLSRLEETLTDNADVTHSATVINRAMETLILQKPSQYLWSYNRYKAPPPLQQAMTSDAE